MSYVRAYPWPEGLVTEREFCTGLLAAAAPAIIAAHRKHLAAAIRGLWGEPVGNAIAYAIEKGQI